MPNERIPFITTLLALPATSAIDEASISGATHYGTRYTAGSPGWLFGNNGATLLTGDGVTANERDVMPKRTALALYPIPTRQQSTRTFSLQTHAETDLAVYDLLGRRLYQVGIPSAGRRATTDGRDPRSYVNGPISG